MEFKSLEPKTKLALLLFGLMGFFAMGDNYAASPMLVDISGDFNVDIGTAALSVAAYMFPFGLFTLLFGPLGDRYGKAKIISIAAFGTAIFSCLGALAFNITSLAAVRAVNGALGAGILPVTISYVGDLFEEQKQKMNAIGSVMGMYFLGAAAATAIGGGLSFIGSWRLVYLVYGIAELIIAILMLKYLAFTPGTAKSIGFRQAYANAFSQPFLLKTVVLLFLVGIAVFGSFTYLGDFLVEKTRLNILYTGLLMTPFGLATYIGGQKAGNIRQKLGPKITLFAGILGVISWALLGQWPGFYYVFPILVVFGFAFVLLQSTIIVTAQQQLPRQRGIVMSLTSFNMFVGGGLGILINKFLLTRWSYETIFIIAALAFLLASFLAYRLLLCIARQDNLAGL
ncbi:MAG: MFS transporter [Dethiobacteria bacterium]|jgi:predicted MFS family arabinose efflux permease